jgi:hypothetical protein
MSIDTDLNVLDMVMMKLAQSCGDKATTIELTTYAPLEIDQLLKFNFRHSYQKFERVLGNDYKFFFKA